MMNIKNITLTAAVAASANAIKINSIFDRIEEIANADKHNSIFNDLDNENGFGGTTCMYCMQPAVDSDELLGGETPANPSSQKAHQVLAQVEAENFWDDIGTAVSDAGKWTEGAVSDAAKWTEGAAKTIGNGIAGASVALGTNGGIATEAQLKEQLKKNMSSQLPLLRRIQSEKFV